MVDRIRELSLENVIGDRFGRYSKYIIQERALPDVRDGLKPVQRRILFAMYQDGNTADKPFRKAAKAVGNVMGNYHPHGDSSIYEATIRMSQVWKQKLPLIEVHGNNGSIDGDPAAAMRYTETRLSKAADLMLAGIDNNTVEMVLNFDDTINEPVVLPAAFPNLLINGSTGISAGYATQIPPHNLSEVINALIYLIKHPDAKVQDLMNFIKGPDFPTGGIVQGLSGIVSAYETGRGRIIVRSKTKVETKGKSQRIIVTEIPYEVNKAQLVKRIEDLKLNKKIDGIKEIRDESDRSGLSISIELKKDFSADQILNYLYKNTDLQVSYNFNMIAIDGGKPKLLGLKEILDSYLSHRSNVVLKRTHFFLEKANKRTHIIDGLIKAVSILDEVILTIRNSENRLDAIQNLIEKFQFTNLQSEAIVNLQLYRLTNTDIESLKEERSQLVKQIEEYQKIISDSDHLGNVLIKEFKKIIKDFGSERLSKIEDNIEPLNIKKEVIIPNENTYVGVSKEGYIKRASLKSVGEDDGLKESDSFVYCGQLNTADELYIFTNYGNLIYRKVFEIDNFKWKDPGTHLSQSSGLADDECIIKVVPIVKREDKNILVATNNGYVKQMNLREITPKSRYLNRAIKIIKFKEEDNQVISIISFVGDNHNLLTVTKNGMGLKCTLKEIPVQKEKSSGVKLINLGINDEVQNVVDILSDEYYLGILTIDGVYKNVKISDIPLTSRAKKGVQLIRTNSKDGINIFFSFIYLKLEDVHYIVQTSRNKQVEFDPSSFPISSRQAVGKSVYNYRSFGYLIKVEKIKRDK